MYFSEYKFAVEIEEKGHANRNQDKENERHTKILTANFFTGLILMKRVLIFFLKLVKYGITLPNQMNKN